MWPNIYQLDRYVPRCDDGSCCCMTSRSMMMLLSIINLIASVIDTQLSLAKPEQTQSLVLKEVYSLKTLLVTVYQMANILLLIAAVAENAALLQVFLWYSLGFTVLSLVITIAEYVLKFQESDSTGYLEFVIEVIFLFVTFRCLPIVDIYRKHLDELALRRSY